VIITIFWGGPPWILVDMYRGLEGIFLHLKVAKRIQLVRSVLGSNMAMPEIWPSGCNTHTFIGCQHNRAYMHHDVTNITRTVFNVDFDNCVLMRDVKCHLVWKGKAKCL
jgi:hypothetical protein